MGCPRALPEGFLDHMEHQCCGNNQMGRQFLREYSGVDRAERSFVQAMLLIRSL